MIKFLFLPLLAVASLVPQQATAHPHEFVTMNVTVQFNPAGQVTGMRYHWQFDEFFSAYALEGQDKNGNGTAEPEEMDALLKEILGNIDEIAYFTKFDAEGAVPDLGKAVPVSATLDKRQFNAVFDVPFKAALDVKKKPLRYAIYDDEFYIAMLHKEGKEAVQLASPAQGCAWDLRAADPDDDVVAFAGSLDKTQSGGSDLGKNFAEWVSVSCK